MFEFGSVKVFITNNNVDIDTKLINVLKGGTYMLWTILIILLILWALGFAFHIAGGLIHVLLVIALIVLIIRLVTGRKVP